MEHGPRRHRLDTDFAPTVLPPRRRKLRASAIAVVAGSVMAGLCACHPKKPTHATGRTRKGLKVEVYTESSHVNDLVAQSGFLWVGTSNGLIRWNLARASAMTLTKNDGLPGNQILAIAPDAHNGLWVASPEGIARYDGHKWRQYANCPLGKDIQAIAPSSDGTGIWAGGTKGLVRYVFGRWAFVRKNLPVTAILNDIRSEAVWVGTTGKGLWYCTPAKCTKYGRDRGLDMSTVSHLSFADVGVIALGSCDQGDRLAIRAKNRWYTYRLKPSVLLQWSSFAMNKMYLAAGNHLYLMKAGRCGSHKAGLRLIGPSTARNYCLKPLTIPLPSHVTSASSARGKLWLGTQSNGVSRYDGGKRYTLYRTSNLTVGARYLSVACTGPIDCYVATGGSAFKFDDTDWTTIDNLGGTEEEIKPLYFLNDPKSGVTAIARNEAGELAIAYLKDGDWKFRTLAEPIRGTSPLAVTTAAYAPNGDLWIGIANMDQSGDQDSFGAVQVRRNGTILYHRNFQGEGEVRHGSLSLSNSVSDFAFQGNTVWVATNQGACEVQQPSRLRCRSGSDGLSSDVVRALAIAANGTLWAGSAEGVDFWRGSTFHLVTLSDIDARVGDLAVDGDTVWMASSEGLIRYQNHTATLYDDDAGLLQTKVRSITKDNRGRLWVLHPAGISIVTLH